ncbi:hypothetical protein [Leclercia adecarboxylata]|uniref:Ead/Ea22-like family protein n=1 Tax=Leclercia adecarboxylata TaxID=83655 RepID=A0ABU6I4W0_9ENTR|nr:hypothetical protein [Leclercia adecarboxylata]MBZ3802092.1 hypothetical protein [Leclercia adecarboxylata]MBZ3806722.1 hypothetical protein [Leclercia adecarboxylata]MEC3903042.1 hypothetical protein [Leclercia adecarboxylata]MEC3936622.1 hypothetical protein [Leclercia adecarboxylata]QEY54891.1 hypothetical protein FTX45_08595 [Leclercia adecarboxylata]
MRLTNIQLIHAAHHAARYLPKASAELVRELATRLDVVLVAQREAAKQRDALAAENAGLKTYICDECYVESVRTGHYACAGHGMPSTPATDAYLAEVRAQGVEMFSREMHAEISEADAIEFAAQLRQDANTAELVAAGIIIRGESLGGKCE